jgi:hypothetical protein
MPWWIYIIGPSSGWPVKVGYSRNLVKRLAMLQYGATDELVLFKKYPVGSKSRAMRMERMIHKELDLLKGTKWKDRDTRRSGEWFNVFSDDAIAAASKAFAYQEKLGALIDKDNLAEEKASFYGYID